MKDLYVDQYGQRFYASTLKELRGQIGMGGSRVSIMYYDRQDGKAIRCGYVIGGHWLQKYVAVQEAA